MEDERERIGTSAAGSLAAQADARTTVGEQPRSGSECAMDAAGRLSLDPEGAQGEARKEAESAREKAQAYGEAKMRGLYRRYCWRVQVGTKKIARPAATHDRCTGRAVTVRGRGESGGTDGDEG